MGGGGGGAVTFSCGRQTFWRPPYSRWKNILDPPPQIYDKNVRDPPPAQPPKHHCFFLAALNHNEGSNIARCHIPKLYSDIQSIAKLFSISTVEWGDKLTKTAMMQISPQSNGYFVHHLMKHGCISRGSGCFAPRSQRMFDAEGAEIATNIAIKNRHKFKHRLPLREIECN